MISEYKRNWNNNNTDKLRAYRRRYRQKYPEKDLLKRAKDRCRSSGQVFEITLEDIVIPTICPILGIPIILHDKEHPWNAPSLDRIDNSKGYVKGNVAVISRSANNWKSDMTLEQIRKLYEYVFPTE